jgi:membrane-associated HD superfamily phosphohydrolase
MPARNTARNKIGHYDNFVRSRKKLKKRRGSISDGYGNVTVLENNTIRKMSEISSSLSKVGYAVVEGSSGVQQSDITRVILSYKGVMMKKHLLEGVRKGAFTEVQIEDKFNTLLKEKENHIIITRQGHDEEADDAKKEKIKAEESTNKFLYEEEIFCKVLSISDESVTMLCLVDNDNFFYEERIFDKEPFNGLRISKGSLVRISVKTGPGIRCFNYSIETNRELEEMFKKPKDYLEDIDDDSIFT